MRVDEKLSLGEYCHAMKGSRIDAEHEDDEEGRFALISHDYFYFGRNAIDVSEIPDRYLDHPFEKTGPGYRCDFTEEFISEFAKWLKANFKVGVHGSPCKPLSKLKLSRCPTKVRRKHVVLLRVGIDAGCGGIQGPLFEDGTFEFICIPDNKCVSVHTYGSMLGRDSRPHASYFGTSRSVRMAKQHVHVDPEWETFTYGDPTPPKRSLQNLKPGDFLVFYCGLQGWDPACGWDCDRRPALYLAGYFKVARAGIASTFADTVLKREFANNFHVRYPSVFKQEKHRLVLVKGDNRSRLFRKAIRISSEGKDRRGRPLKILSPAMRNIFGDFGGHVSIQRSPPRWVESRFVERAIDFVNRLD